jgi:hypothetical protein
MPHRASAATATHRRRLPFTDAGHRGDRNTWAGSDVSIASMWLPFVFALAVPSSFAHAVDARIATDHMHVVDWWADDLDGDHVNESIALVCNEEAGRFLVQHGSDLLEAPAAIDGRNACPEAPATRPAWRIEKSGVISQNVNVHHGNMGHALAIRGGQLVLVRQNSSGFEVGRDGNTDEEDQTDYDALTWSHRIQPPHGRAKRTSGPLVLVTDKVRRPAKLVGTTTLAASRGESTMTLHVHADRALVVRDCSDKPCKTTKIAKGDHDVAVAIASELEIVAGPTKLAVHFEPLEGEASYPPPPES